MTIYLVYDATTGIGISTYGSIPQITPWVAIEDSLFQEAGYIPSNITVTDGIARINFSALKTAKEQELNNLINSMSKIKLDSVNYVSLYYRTWEADDCLEFYKDSTDSTEYVLPTEDITTEMTRKKQLKVCESLAELQSLISKIKKSRAYYAIICNKLYAQIQACTTEEELQALDISMDNTYFDYTLEQPVI